MKRPLKTSFVRLGLSLCFASPTTVFGAQAQIPQPLLGLVGEASQALTAQNIRGCARRLGSGEVNKSEKWSDPHPTSWKTYGGIVCARFEGSGFEGGFDYFSLASYDQKLAPLWVVRSDRGTVLTFPPFRSFLEKGVAHTLPPAELSPDQEWKLRCILEAADKKTCAPRL